MEDIARSRIQVDVNFIVIGRMVSGAAVECSHMKRIVH